MYANEWAQSFNFAYQNMLAQVVEFLPNFIMAMLVIILGFIVAGILKEVVIRVCRELKLDSALDAAGVDTVTERAGYRLDSGRFLGTLVRWFVIIVAFIAALDILNLDQATAFLSSVLAFLPQVIVAVLMLVVGTIVAGFVRNLIVAGGRATKFGSPSLLGRVAYIAIIAFTVLAAMNQLGVANELIQMLFAGIVFGCSLAFGLAFGLGGKEAAARTIESYRGRM